MRFSRQGMVINFFIGLLALTTFVLLNLFTNHKLALSGSLILFIAFTLTYNIYFYYPIFKRYIEYLKYKDDEWFDIVDENGEKIGRAARTICHKGSMLLHPVVHVHIINNEGRLLLQKRSLTKKIQPGRWDTSVGGHINSGEPLERAIARETKEELGVDLDLKALIPVKNYIFQSSIEKEYVYSYIYYYDGPITFQKEEIDETRLFFKAELEELIIKGETTENFIKEFHLIKDDYLN